MGTITYKIEKTNQLTYFLKVTNKRILFKDEFYSIEITIPFLDYIKSIKKMGVYDHFLKCVTDNFDYPTILTIKDNLTSFLWLIGLSIKDYYHNVDKQVIEIEQDYKDDIKILLQKLTRDHIKVDVTSQLKQSILSELLNDFELYHIESFIYHQIIDDCKTLINEYLSDFNDIRSGFSEDCVKKGFEKQLKKQFRTIKDLEIKETDIQKIDKILSKNPDLMKPNILGLYGKELVNYLIKCNPLDLIGFQKSSIIVDKNTNIFCHNNKYMWKLIFHLNGKDLEIYPNKNNIMYWGTTIYPSHDPIYIDVNIPFVKDVKFIQNTTDENESNIVIELTNIDDNCSLDEDNELVLILNEDVIPCLIDFKLLKTLMIDKELSYNLRNIIIKINQKLEGLKSLENDEIQQMYINQYITSGKFKETFIQDQRNTEYRNNRRSSNFYYNKTVSFFLYQLCHRYKKSITPSNGGHQYVISDTVDQDDVELGRRTELVVYWYLQRFIENDNWFYSKDFEGIDSQDNNRTKKWTQYKDYPYNTIKFSYIEWNNKSEESFKPYDLLIEFEGVKFKIEVKSTRGNEENVFFISVTELEELLKDPKHYFILRLSYITKGRKVFGIQFNEEFYGSFYRIKPDTIKLVKKKLREWKEYYKENRIRFTVNQFEEIPNTFHEESSPVFLIEPTVYDSKYWKYFETFLKDRYFNDLDRIFETYSVFPDVSNLLTDYLELKSDEKFFYNHDIEDNDESDKDDYDENKDNDDYDETEDTDTLPF